MMSKRDIDEVEEVRADALEQTEMGESKFPGMSYEEGVAATLAWVFGETDESPMED